MRWEDAQDENVHETVVECHPDRFNTPKYVLSASAVARDTHRFGQRSDPSTTERITDANKCRSVLPSNTYNPYSHFSGCFAGILQPYIHSFFQVIVQTLTLRDRKGSFVLYNLHGLANFVNKRCILVTSNIKENSKQN